MTRSDEIVERYGLPREMVSCPDCGDIYGQYNRNVCETCGCCSKCCNCSPEKRVLVDPETFINENT